MKFRILGLVFVLLGLFAFLGCNNSPANPPEENQALQASFDELFTLTVKQSASFDPDNLVLVLNEVSDSRCPADAQCIRAGEVVVKASIFKGEERLDDVTLQLSESDEEAAWKVVDGYRLEVVEVTPYPKSGVTVTPEEYDVTFKVVKQAQAS